MKVKKLENFQNVKGAKGCKWSSLKAPGAANPLSHPILELEEFPFLIIGPLAGFFFASSDPHMSLIPSWPC